MSPLQSRLSFRVRKRVRERGSESIVSCLAHCWKLSCSKLFSKICKFQISIKFKFIFHYSFNFDSNIAYCLHVYNIQNYFQIQIVYQAGNSKPLEPTNSEV